MAIFFNVRTPSNHLHSLQVENCDSNSRLVVDEDDNGKFRFQMVKILAFCLSCLSLLPIRNVRLDPNFPNGNKRALRLDQL